MILYFVLVGFVTGAVGAGCVLYAGGGVLLAVLAYSGAGALGVLVSALVIALAPNLPRPRPHGGLPAGTHPMRAHSPVNPARARPTRARPMRARHARVEAQAHRR